jgi:CO/xanthine dehydrogenase Mo-binding subunit
MALLHGRTGRLTAKNGGFGPGQCKQHMVGGGFGGKGDRAHPFACAAALAAVCTNRAVRLGLGRIGALHDRSSTSYQIC